MKIDLEPQELDVVMTGLANMPWRVANPVINKIMGQVNGPASGPLPTITPPAGEDPDRHADGTLKRID